MAILTHATRLESRTAPHHMTRHPKFQMRMNQTLTRIHVRNPKAITEAAAGARVAARWCVVERGRVVAIRARAEACCADLAVLRPVQCRAMPCSAAARRASPGGAELRHAAPRPKPRRIQPHRATLRHAAPHSTVLRHAAPRRAVLCPRRAEPHRVAPRRAALRHAEPSRAPRRAAPPWNEPRHAVPS